MSAAACENITALIYSLNNFWQKQGCSIIQPFDMQVGAGTFHPATFLRSIGPEPWRAAYVQPSRRPADSRYGANPNRLGHYFQYQVVIKPSPDNYQKMFLQSLVALGLTEDKFDIRFVADDWQSPTLDAYGTGWEVWVDGLEIAQFTYFQKVGGIKTTAITGELTYGIERIAMFLQQCDHIFEILWDEHLTYGQLFAMQEQEQGQAIFEHFNHERLLQQFDLDQKWAEELCDSDLSTVAYEYVIRASHTFNLLDACGALSVTERTRRIAIVRELAKKVAAKYLQARERLGFPLLNQPT